MKRALPALGMTGFGVGLLLSFDTRTPAPDIVTTGSASVAVAPAAAGPDATTPPASAAAVTAPPSTAPATTSGPAIVAPATAGVTAATEPPTSASPTTASAAIAPPATATPPATAAPPATAIYTIDGPVATTRWGPVQVQITVHGGVLSEVVALQSPSEHRKSVGINEWAIPALRDEALAAQSANIDVVSGATVTWGGYTASLQAALDAVPR